MPDAPHSTDAPDGLVLASAASRDAGPVRTCVGCRKAAGRDALVRLVVDRRTNDDGLTVVVDERRSLPGRGAWVHPDRRCLEFAEKRRAVTRALRLDGPAVLTAVHSWFDNAGRQ